MNILVNNSRATLSPDSLTQHLDEWFSANSAMLIGIRRHIHMHPELSGQEFNTAALIADKLAAAGLSPQLIPGRNGVICEVGSGDTVIAIRGDIDALPLQDVTESPYASTVPGVCHACGHDVHTTVTLGVMLALAEIADQLPFRVRALFQPCEEVPTQGAVDFVEAGALEGVSEIYSLHCYPQLHAGQIGLRAGPLTSAFAHAKIKLTGPGGHTARPQLTVDLVAALGRVITDVPAIIERRFDARSGLLCVFGKVFSGTAPNVIPREAFAECSLRTVDTDVWRQVPKVFEEVVTQVVAPTGAQVEVEYIQGVPPVVNNEQCVATFEGAVRRVLGDTGVQPAPHSMAGEDFAWYLEHVPGAMMRLGTGIRGRSMDLHQGDFDVDERAIEVGVRVMTQTIFDAHTRLMQ